MIFLQYKLTTTTTIIEIFIIYNTIWSKFVQWFCVRIVRWQSNLVNTKESIFPVCDDSYHRNKKKVQKGKVIDVLRNCAFRMIFPPFWTVISKEHPVSGGGGEFPDHVLMNVTVRVRVRLRANLNPNPKPNHFWQGHSPFWQGNNV